MPGTIITVTPNTAFDYVIDVAGFDLPGRVQASRSSLYPSGKGINVARTVASLGSPAIALGFVGASDLDRYRAYDSPLLDIELLPVAGDTRINVTILDTLEREQSHIRTAGFSISQQDLYDLAGSIQRFASEGDIVVISGSFPPGAGECAAGDLVETARSTGAKVFLDTSGPRLRSALANRPDLVKPNLAELEEHIGEPLGCSEHAIIEAARALSAESAETVVVSRGRQGALAISRGQDKVWRARVNIDSESTVSRLGVGSGDALVAGLAVSESAGRELSEALRLGVACGAAKRFTPDPGDCPARIIKRLLSRVVVEAIPQ